MDKTNVERQSRHVQKQKELGFVRYRIWVKPEWKSKIEEFVTKLKKDG